MSTTLQITLNGTEREFAAPLTVAALLVELEITGRRVAVMINDEIVGRTRYEEQSIAPGDRVEVIHMVGGG